MSPTARLAEPSKCDEPHPLLGEVRLAVARAAAAWRDFGVEDGESVAIGLADAGEFIVACLGAAAAGAEPIAIDPLLPGEQLQRLCAQGGWRFILVESREGQPVALRDFLLTGPEWREALRAAAPLDNAGQPVSP